MNSEIAYRVETDQDTWVNPTKSQLFQPIGNPPSRSPGHVFLRSTIKRAFNSTIQTSSLLQTVDRESPPWVVQHSYQAMLGVLSLAISWSANPSGRRIRIIHLPSRRAVPAFLTSAIFLDWPQSEAPALVVYSANFRRNCSSARPTNGKQHHFWPGSEFKQPDAIRSNCESVPGNHLNLWRHWRCCG